MSTLQERLAIAMAPPCTVTAADLARACKVKAPSVHEWINGPTKTLKGPNAVRVARELSVNVEWLTTGRGPMRGSEAANTQPTTLDAAPEMAEIRLLLGLTAQALAASIRPAGEDLLKAVQRVWGEPKEGSYAKDFVDSVRAQLPIADNQRTHTSRAPRKQAHQ